MSSPLVTYSRMIKLSHSIFAMPFALAAAVLAAREVAVTWDQIVWSVLCMVFARSSAMGFNRMNAQDGMTMMCVTHEMGFARRVADRVVFMRDGAIVEVAPPEDFFERPQHEETRQFLSQILGH